jgi:hypothetical protein
VAFAAGLASGMALDLGAVLRFLLGLGLGVRGRMALTSRSTMVLKRWGWRVSREEGRNADDRLLSVAVGVGERVKNEGEVVRGC